MDKNARALQIARSVAHRGDAYVYSPGTDTPDILFKAEPAALPATTPLHAPDAPHPLAIGIARLNPATGTPLFATKQPEAGDYFRTPEGHSYRIIAAPLDPRADLLIYTLALA